MSHDPVEEARLAMRPEAQVIPLNTDAATVLPKTQGGLDHKSPPRLAFVRRRLARRLRGRRVRLRLRAQRRSLLPLLRPLYEHWFRVEMIGLEQRSRHGPALIVGNHSGTLPLDGVMLQVGLHDEHPAHRNLRLLGADLVYQVPVLAHLARKSGHTLACQADADRLLAKDELVGVFPEGFKGVGKPYRERYKLQRFGRGGFVATALRAQVPIIPCAIVGAEEIYPKIADLQAAGPAARLPLLPGDPDVAAVRAARPGAAAVQVDHRRSASRSAPTSTTRRRPTTT